METPNPTPEMNKKKLSNASTTPIRVLKSTAKRLRTLITKLNRKSYGKKIKVDDIITKSLFLLEEKHLQEIKAASLSNFDRINIAYKNHCKSYPGTTKDEFLGMLLNEKNLQKK